MLSSSRSVSAAHPDAKFPSPSATDPNSNSRREHPASQTSPPKEGSLDTAYFSGSQSDPACRPPPPSPDSIDLTQIFQRLNLSSVEVRYCLDNLDSISADKYFRTYLFLHGKTHLSYEMVDFLVDDLCQSSIAALLPNLDKLAKYFLDDLITRADNQYKEFSSLPKESQFRRLNEGVFNVHVSGSGPENPVYKYVAIMSEKFPGNLLKSLQQPAFIFDWFVGDRKQFLQTFTLWTNCDRNAYSQHQTIRGIRNSCQEQWQPMVFNRLWTILERCFSVKWRALSSIPIYKSCKGFEEIGTYKANHEFEQLGFGRLENLSIDVRVQCKDKQGEELGWVRVSNLLTGEKYCELVQ